MLRLSGLCLVVLLACGRGGEPKDPIARGPTCASVMPKLTQATVKGAEDGGASEDQVGQVRRDAEQIEPRLVQACIEDRWSPELLACLDQRSPDDEPSSCNSFITPAQVESVMQLRDAQVQEGER